MALPNPLVPPVIKIVFCISTFFKIGKVEYLQQIVNKLFRINYRIKITSPCNCRV